MKNPAAHCGLCVIVGVGDGVVRVRLVVIEGVGEFDGEGVGLWEGVIICEDEVSRLVDDIMDDWLVWEGVGVVGVR
jgi:hypothetical protein